MARYNEILVGRFNRALQKAFAMKGEPPAPQLASEIAPNVSLSWGAEYRYVEGWNKVGGRISVPAVAAQTSVAEFRNPATSGVIAVLEKITCFITAVPVQIALSIGVGATQVFPLVGSQLNFDSRVQKTFLAFGSCSVSGKNNNPTTYGTIVSGPGAPANTNIEFITTDIQEFPILPNSFVHVAAGAVNTAIDVTFWWRERPLEDSEVT